MYQAMGMIQTFEINGNQVIAYGSHNGNALIFHAFIFFGVLGTPNFCSSDPQSSLTNRFRTFVAFFDPPWRRVLRGLMSASVRMMATGELAMAIKAMAAHIPSGELT